MVLRFRSGTDPEAYVRSLYDPSSPNYHQFLTPESFADKFAPSTQDYQSIIAWLSARGINATAAPDRLIISISGQTRTIQRALGASFSLFKNGTSVFYSNTRAVRMPAYIGAFVRTIVGLHNFTLMKIPSIRDESDPTYTPSDIRNAYDETKLVSNLGYTGSGQTIDILDFYDYPNLFNDLNTFDSYFSLPSTSVTKVLINSPSTCPNTGTANYCIETALDVQWAHVMAPGAAIHVILVPDLTDSSIEAGINYVVNTDLKNGGIFSNSWGGAEMCQNILGQKFQCDSSFISAVDAMLLQGASQGISTFFSSGDKGAYENGGCYSCQTILTVNFPASDPWVTGVGGTSLTSTNGPLETAWSGSGGGLSGVFAEPAYQSADFSISGRGVPDVSADADPSTGVYIYCNQSPECSGFYNFGGTSLSAPVWAGSIAELNQAIGQSLGFINPLLYAIYGTSEYSRDFHDITSGNNGGYSASSGWDPVTGLGSPDLFETAQNRGMTKASVNPSTVTQNQMVTYSGSGFSPNSQVQIVIWNDGTGYQVGTPTSSNSGSISGNFLVGTNINPGQRRVTFTDTASGFVASVNIQVNELTITQTQLQTVTSTLVTTTTTSTTSTFQSTTTTTSTLTSFSTLLQGCSVTTTSQATTTLIQVATTTTSTSSTTTTKTTSTSTYATATSSISTTTTKTTTTTTTTQCTQTLTSTMTSLSSTTFTRPSTSIGLNGSPTTVSLGSFTTLSGGITPDPGSVQVTLSLSSDGITYTPIMIVAADSTGAYTADWFPAYPGNYYVEASWVGNNQLAGSTSSPITLTVTGAVTPSATILLSAPSTASRGQLTHFSMTIFNPQGSPLTTLVSVEITGPNNYILFDTIQVTVTGGSYSTLIYEWTPPNNQGTYFLSVGLTPPQVGATDTATISVT
jgi:kumamolisin